MKRTTVMIDEGLLFALDEFARKNGITKSQALRDAIAAYTGRGKRRGRRALPSFAGSGSSRYPGSLGRDAERLVRQRATRKGLE